MSSRHGGPATVSGTDGSLLATASSRAAGWARPLRAVSAPVRGWRARSAARGHKPIWLALPAALMFLLLLGIPTLLTLYLSFHDITLRTLGQWLSSPWIGFQNYVAALTAGNAVINSARSALWISIKFAGLTTVFDVPMGLLVGLAMNHRFRGRGLLRSMFLVPYVIPTFVVAFVGRAMFLHQTGFVDQVLGLLHLGDGGTYWLLGSKAFWTMLITEVWSTWPFIYIMVVAGLSTISSDLYDAAALDGAGYWAKTRYVALPGIRGVLLLAVLLSTIFHLGNFTIPFVMFGATPPPSVQVLPINIFFRAFSTFQYGMAAATAILMLIVLVIPCVLYVRRTQLHTSEEAR